jgi:hypothetical protein
LGLAAFIAAKIAAPQWQEFLFGIGSLLIGIAVTVWLTIAQKANADRASRIVDRCDQAGIETIFASRRTDVTALEAALLTEFANSQNIWLLGVAFRSLFDPSEEYTLAFREFLYDPAKCLRVLILDRDCEAANERKEIEKGNATIDHISDTLSNGLVACIVGRLQNLKSRAQELDLSNPHSAAGVLKRLNIRVRTYKSLPVAQVMKFDDFLFCEQYHIGRPPEIVQVGSCIGKFMPIIQFRRGSYGYCFMESHFETVWNESNEISHALFGQAWDLVTEDFAQHVHDSASQI